MKKFNLDYYSLICSKARIILKVSIVFAIAFSCTSALYIPFSGQVTSEADLAELQAGRKLYIQKCSGCHTLILPEKYNKQEWQHWVDKMLPKVSLDTSEKQHIIKYLTKGK